MNINLRLANTGDFLELYEIGKNTPEMRVSATEDFMDKDEFEWSIENRNGIFLVAEEGEKIMGFLYASSKDLELSFENKYACLVYLVVLPEFRKKGVAQALYTEAEERLKRMGLTHLYTWASTEGKEIIPFMKKQGFKEGHEYRWMDKRID